MFSNNKSQFQHQKLHSLNSCCSVCCSRGCFAAHFDTSLFSKSLAKALCLFLYGRNVNDIDLNAGGLSEAIVANQTFAVGPTFGYKLMEQFAALKKGDRLYYENALSAS
jgi:hypothetical protein